MSTNNTAVPTEGRLAANPLDFVSNEMPFDVPYGIPISLDRAQTVIHATVAVHLSGFDQYTEKNKDDH
jgi:glc operon protein GlcG